MRFVKNKAIGTNWLTLLIAGTPVKGKTHTVKVARKRSKVVRYGSDVAEAQTHGIREVDPMTIEFDAMGALTIMTAFGITDGVAATVALGDKVFEIVEAVQDPDKSPFGAGGFTSTGKGCQVDAVEVKWEVGENPTSMTWTISMLDWTHAAHDKGGGGFKV